MTERRTTVTLEIQDKFSNALNNFATGMEKAAEAMKRTSTSATKLVEVGQKVDDVGRKSQAMSDKLQTAFGGSSRAVNVFGNALGNAVGLTGEMGYALDVLMDSGMGAATTFGLLTAGTAALGMGVSALKKYIDDANKAFEDEKRVLSQTSVSLEEYRQKTLEAQRANDIFGARTVKTLNDANDSTVNWLNDSSERMVNWLNGSGKLTTAQIAAAEAANRLSAAEYEVGQAIRVVVDGQTRAIVEGAAHGKTLIESAEALARTEGKSEQFNKSIEVQADYLRRVKGMVNEYNASLANLAEGYTAAGVSGLTTPFVAPGRSADDMRDPYEIQRSVWGMPDNSGPQREKEQKAEQRARAVASILKQTQSQALSLYNSLADGSSKTAKQVSADFADAFVGIMQAEADLNNNTGLSMIQLQQVFGKAFDGMSQDMVGKLLGVMDAGGAMAQSLISQLYAIAAGGGTAAEQIEAIRAALAGLPTDKYINIHLKYKASGPGGNQQGDEWNFTLEGEAYSTRAAYMQQYGDYGRANDAWQRDHRAELNSKGVTGPGQANTETGEVYQYAYGEHSVVTSPRMMLVGERGPERVDITPGTGARGGNGGGAVTVNFNSLVPPNEFEVRQLAAKLKSYMRL